MDIKIALISEGVRDMPIIDAILKPFFTKNKAPEPYILNKLLPEENESVGWRKGLNYCASDKFRGAFILNEFVIIQVDSDVHADKGFGVPNQENTSSLLQAIKEKIIEKIGNEFYQPHQERILFCICVDQIECWFLPFHATTKAHKTKQINCISTVNEYFLKLHGYSIAKNYKYYTKAAILLSHKKEFYKNYIHSESLKVFVENELEAKIKFGYNSMQTAPHSNQ